MSIVATDTSYLLKLMNDKDFYTVQQMHATNAYDANEKKLSKQVKAEEKWEKAYDSALDPERALNCRGVHVNAGNQSEATAKRYADAKAREYNAALSQELADLDVEYDMWKTMYDTMLTEVNAQIESAKTNASTAAQDTGLLQQ